RPGACYVMDYSQAPGLLRQLLLFLRVTFGLVPKESCVYIVRCETAFEMLSKTSPSAVEWWRENHSQLFTRSAEMAFQVVDCEEIEDLDSTSNIALINSEREPMRSRGAPTAVRDQSQKHPSYIPFDELFRGVAVRGKILFGAVSGLIFGVLAFLLAMRDQP